MTGAAAPRGRDDLSGLTAMGRRRVLPGCTPSLLSRLHGVGHRPSRKTRILPALVRPISSYFLGSSKVHGDPNRLKVRLASQNRLLHDQIDAESTRISGPTAMQAIRNRPAPHRQLLI